MEFQKVCSNVPTLGAFLLSPSSSSPSPLLCSTAGTGLHHLLRGSFLVLARMNSWPLFWRSDWLIPAGHLCFSSLRVIELSLAECQVRGGLSLPPFMCPANGPGGIWGYVNNLMRSKVWESPLLSPRPNPPSVTSWLMKKCLYWQNEDPILTFTARCHPHRLLSFLT